MTTAKLAARRITLMLNDQKWYEIERAIEEAIEEGQARGETLAYDQGFQHGVRSMNPAPLRRGDDYAPPVGPVREPVMTALKPISGGFVPGTLVYMGLGWEQPARLIDNKDGSHLEPVPSDRQSYEEG